MNVLINPGSGPVPGTGEGWTNTYEGAEIEAQRWFRQMCEDGITDVVLILPGRPADVGRWTFEFRHEVTRKVVELETHGVDNMDAYSKTRIFSPRVYWDGSSCGNPKIEDWAVDGFLVVKTFKRNAEEAS
jgi:hypothetical protein